MINELSANGKKIKIVKDPQSRILRIKSLRSTHLEREAIERSIAELNNVQQWDLFKFEVNLLYSLFFHPHNGLKQEEVIKPIRRVFYKVSVLLEILLNVSVHKMIADGFFFKSITTADPQYLKQLFDIAVVIYTRNIKI